MILYRLSSGTASTYCDFIWVSAKVMNIFLDPFKCQLLIVKSQIRILSIVPKTKWPYSFNFCKIIYNIRITKSLGEFQTLFPEKVKFSNIEKHLFYSASEVSPLFSRVSISWAVLYLAVYKLQMRQVPQKRVNFKKIWHWSNF